MEQRVSSRLVAQAFLPVGSGDIPVVRSGNTGQECPVNPQAGKPALQSEDVAAGLSPSAAFGKSRFMKQTFHDHFSDAANRYADFRPRYPAALFDYLASLVSRKSPLWDCASGRISDFLLCREFPDNACRHAPLQPPPCQFCSFRLFVRSVRRGRTAEIARDWRGDAGDDRKK